MRPIPAPLRSWLYRQLGMNVRGRVLHGCFFDSRNVTIGNGTFVNVGCYFNARYSRIEIGPDCDLAQQVLICTTTHQIGSQRRAGSVTGRPVRVGAGSWIGARATILPGVTIGERCVIAAGAVVTRDCEPDCFYAGVPAKLTQRYAAATNDDGESVPVRERAPEQPAAPRVPVPPSPR